MYIGGIPIVSLDSVYLEPDNDNIYFLDCTRLDGSKDLVSRTYPNDQEKVTNQIKNISNNLMDDKIDSIILADDVVFSGSVLKKIIKEFKSNGIGVLGIRSCISTIDAYEYFNATLPLGLKCGCLLGKDTIDQICERDFYFGIAQSGISVKEGGEILKAPYFKPFGNPVERASIPFRQVDGFSKGCLIRSLALWDGIQKLSGKEILVRDLPEKIVRTNPKDKVLTLLKNKYLNYDKERGR